MGARKLRLLRIVSAAHTTTTHPELPWGFTQAPFSHSQLLDDYPACLGRASGFLKHEETETFFLLLLGQPSRHLRHG